MRDMNEPISHNSSSRTKFKQRIAGGTVLLIVLAIFLPFIINHAHNAAVNLETSPAVNPVAAETAPAPQNPQAAPATTPAQEAPTADAATPTVSESHATPTLMTVEQSESSTLSQPDNTVTLPPPQAANPAPNTIPTTAEAPASATTDNQASAAPTTAPTSTIVPAKSNIETKTAPAAPNKKTAPITGRWVLQVGSFGNIENAQQLSSQLRARGYHAYTQRANDRVRVYVGPLTSLQQVQKVQEQIQSQFRVSALVHEVRH